MRTKDKVSEIIGEIEDKNSATGNYKMSAQDIAKRLNSAGAKMKVDLEGSHVTGNDHVLMTELTALNVKNQTTLARDWPAAGGVRKILLILKKVYWKIRVKLFHAFFQEQNVINGQTVSSLNELNRMRGEYEAELASHADALKRLKEQNDYLIDRVDKLQRIVNSFGMSEGSGLTPAESKEYGERLMEPADVLTERYQSYTSILKGSNPVMEIGTGRGEFLTVMKDSFVKSFGVEPNETVAISCIKKGLDVKNSDGITYLRRLENESLGGVFANGYIETLSKEQVIEVIRESHRCIKEGGYLILESNNPANSSMGDFYANPLVSRPVHPEYVKYLMEITGFESITIKEHANGNKYAITGKRKLLEENKVDADKEE